MAKHLAIDQAALAGFCKKHGIAKLSLFGSVLRDDFGPGSDVDVLVEFEAGADRALTYFELAKMQLELEELFGRPVDLSLANALDRYLRDAILSSAQVQYDAA